jgi:hypothetical protein
VGIIRVKDDKALLVTGTHTGTVGFSVTVTGHDPGADTDGRALERKTAICCRSFRSPSPSRGWSKAQACNLPTGAARADIPARAPLAMSTRRSAEAAQRHGDAAACNRSAASSNRTWIALSL